MSNLKVSRFLGIDSLQDSNIVLKKIHLKRLKSNLPDYIIAFCASKFMESNDVRFFNELLWLVDGNIELIEQSIKKFESNFENSKYKHVFNEVKIDKELYINNPLIDKSILKATSVALIGNPFHFIIPFYYFLAKGKKVDVINLKYHPNKVLNKVLNSSLINCLFKIIFGSSYETISISSKANLRSFKLPKRYDVGFHKLSFIIRDNIISCFNKGLINDHWGLLPFLKGRSTLLYSKLLGVDPVITNHLIDQNIDSGRILCYTSLKKRNQKFNIIFGLYKRIYNSVLLLSSNKFIEIDNKDGLIFYEMHPYLKNKL
tara:strand:+ start:2657 stop:3604 length:948 start_codon:yes stop_codon:yes gene_type:complete